MKKLPALGRAGARRGPEGGRPLLADAGREEGAARAADLRPQGRAARRPRAGRAVGPAAARVGAGRCGARRPVRAAQLQPDRDPQARPPRRIPEEAIAEAKTVAKLPLGDDREDLTHLPIVAIDPADARDHDDAIWASRATTADGWDAIVAIADVSFYVRPGSELDRRRARAATASISPTGWCRCCPRNCRRTSAR